MTTTHTATRMRVVTQSEFGTPDVLTVAEAPRPVPLPTEVLVKVQAAGVNPVDRKTREGGGMAGVLGEPPFVLGWDVAGVIEEVGFGVTTLAVGDRVFGMPWFPRAAGGYGQFVTAPARQFAKVPDNLSIEEAAAVPLAALTAWQALVDTAGVRVTRFLVEPDGNGLAQIADLLERGDVEVVVDEVFALEDAAAAHDKIETGRTRGKLVLRVTHDD
jgi:NADPH:quinone reductase-like Zn-dependent oxidoreductase